MSTITASDTRLAADRVLAPSAFIGEEPRRGFSRRSFLTAISAVSVATISGCGIGGNDPQDIGGGSGRGAGSGVGSRGTTYVPVSPFALTAACELSEDFFLVQTHQIDPANDKVVAYSRADGEVEAMLLQDGAIKQLYRDASQPGGWNIYDLPAAVNSVTDMVAGVSSPPGGPATLKVFWRTSGDPNHLRISVRDAGDTPSFSTSSVPWNDTSGYLQLTVNFDGTLLVAAALESSSRSAQDARIYFYTDTPNPATHQPNTTGYLTGFAYNDAFSGTSQWSAVVAGPWSRGNAPTLFVALPAFTYDPFTVAGHQFNPPSVNIWTWALAAVPPSGARAVSAAAYDTVPPAPPGAGPMSEYRIELSKPMGKATSPSLVVRSKDDKNWHLWTVSPDDERKSWTWTELTLPPDLAAHRVSTGTRPLPSTETVHNPNTSASGMLDIFVVANDTVHVIRQAPQGDAGADAARPVYCPPIALQPDVASMSSQAGRSSGNELLVVGKDGGLQSVLKDPVTGHWSDTAVHLPASELKPVSAYQVTLGVVDFWQAPVPQQTLQLTASTPVTALLDGATLNLGQSPVSAVTDVYGEVHLALVADGLSAPTLTVTGTAVPTATVSPSAAVNGYMKGGTTLNALPPLDAGTLAGAQTPDGQLVAPGAHNDGTAASDAVTNMSLAASQATASTLGARRSLMLERRDGRLGDRKAGGGNVTAQGVLTDIDSWAHDALHAIKKGAVSVEKVSYDAASKAFTLAADFVHWADQALTIVVHGIEDAAHVIQAFFNKLGADIAHAVEWLSALVGSLLKDSALVAQQFSTLVGETLDFVAGHVDALKSSADHWIDSERARVHTIFNQTATAYPAGATVSTMGDYTPVSLGSSLHMKRTRRLLTTDDDMSPQPHGDWFLNKVKHAIGGSLKVPDLSGRSYSQIALDLRNGSASKTAKFQTDCQLFVTNFLVKNVLHPGDGDKLSVHNRLTEVGKLIDSAFDFLESILDHLFEMVATLCQAIKGMLATPISDAGIAGKLLAMAHLGNYEIGSVAAMILAFPTTLTYKLVNGPTTRPFDYVGAGLHTKVGASPAADRALQQTAASVMGVWALLDVFGASLEANGAAIPMLTPAVDTLAPIVLAAIAPPFVTGGLPDWRAMEDIADAPALISWLFALFPAYIDGMGIYAEHQQVFGPQTEDAAKNETFNLWAKTACGVVSLVTGIVAANADGDAGAKDFAIPVLNNLPNITAFCNIHAIEEATEAISVVVGSVVGFAGGEVGALLYAS